MWINSTLSSLVRAKQELRKVYKAFGAKQDPGNIANVLQQVQGSLQNVQIQQKSYQKAL